MTGGRPTCCASPWACMRGADAPARRCGGRVLRARDGAQDPARRLRLHTERVPVRPVERARLQHRPDLDLRADGVHRARLRPAQGAAHPARAPPPPPPPAQRGDESARRRPLARLGLASPRPTGPRPPQAAPGGEASPRPALARLGLASPRRGPDRPRPPQAARPPPDRRTRPASRPSPRHSRDRGRDRGLPLALPLAPTPPARLAPRHCTRGAVHRSSSPRSSARSPRWSTSRPSCSSSTWSSPSSA